MDTGDSLVNRATLVIFELSARLGRCGGGGACGEKQLKLRWRFRGCGRWAFYRKRYAARELAENKSLGGRLTDEKKMLEPICSRGSFVSQAVRSLARGKTFVTC